MCSLRLETSLDIMVSSRRQPLFCQNRVSLAPGVGDFPQDFDKSGLEVIQLRWFLKELMWYFKRKPIVVSSEYQVKSQASLMKHLNPIYLPKSIAFHGPDINLTLFL